MMSLFRLNTFLLMTTALAILGCGYLFQQLTLGPGGEWIYLSISMLIIGWMVGHTRHQARVTRLIKQIQGPTNLESLLEDYQLLSEQQSLHLPILTSMSDVIIYTLDDKVIYVSPEIEAMLGYTQQSWLEGAISWEAIVDSSATSSNEYDDGDRDCALLSSEQKTKWVSLRDRQFLSENKVHHIRYLRDITQRHQYQEQLERLALVASKSQNAVVICDSHGRVEWVNEAFEKLTGYGIDELCGQMPGRILQGPNTDNNTTNYMRKCLEAERGFEVELVNYHKSGRHYWVSIDCSPVFEAGRVVKFVAIEMDITLRKETEQRLKQSEERWHFALDSAGEGVWDWDMSSNKIQLSDGWKRILGYGDDDPSEVNEAMWQSWIHPDDLAVRDLALKNHIEGASSLYISEHRVRRKDGDYAWVAARGKVIQRDENSSPVRFIGTHQDISEQVNTRIALEEKQAMLMRTSRIAKIGGWELRLDTMALKWSNELYELHDLPLTEKPDLARSIEFYAPEARPVIGKAIEAAIMEKEPWDLELPLITAAGRQIWMRSIGHVEEVSGRALRLFGIFQDITEQHALQLHRQNFFDLSMDLITIIQDGQITEVNAAWESLMGFSGSEVIDKPFATHASDRDKEKCDQMLIWLEELCSVTNFEIRFITAEGMERWLSWNAIFESENKTIYAIARDVTDIKHTEEALIKATDDAEAASRAKSEFVATMSHEIRTPMNGVLGMVQLLEETDITLQQKDYIDAIRDSGKALLTIIDDVLDFSKIEAGRLEIDPIPFNLERASFDVVRLLAPKAQEKCIDLVLDYDRDCPLQVVADPGRVRQILMNLLGNAIKFTDKGYVALRIMITESYEKSIWVRFEVEDTGIGINKTGVEKLFQPFSQVDASTTRNYGGTGLGLAISRQLVQLMGGEIGVDSIEGKGTTFWLELPFELGEQPQDSKADLAGRSIMLLEEDSLSRKILVKLCKHWGMLVEVYSNLDDAMINLQDSANKTEVLVVVDNWVRQQPQQFVKSVCHHQPDCKLVVISSQAVKGDGRFFKQAGFHGYLTRPYMHSVLMQLLETVLGQEDSDELVTKHRVKEQYEEKQTSLSGHILLVEDNFINQQVAKAMLESIGLTVDVANHGKEAVAMHAENAASYDLVLMDCLMPEMDGYEATKAIRQSDVRADIPIIALTANAFDSARSQCEAAGMNDYVSKPFEKEQLIDRLKYWLSGDNA